MSSSTWALDEPKTGLEIVYLGCLCGLIRTLETQIMQQYIVHSDESRAPIVLLHHDLFTVRSS